MRVLSLDTTTRAGSVAIVIDDRVVYAERGDERRSHTERLPADVMRALEAASLASADIDVWAVGSGPGSFTGLRTGIATIQGFALVHGSRVVPVSALMALAAAASVDRSDGEFVGAWTDAHRGDVFSALYRTRSGAALDRSLEEQEGASVGLPADTWARWRSRDAQPVALIGDGAALYRQHIDGGVAVLAAPDLAPWIGRIAHARALAGETIGPGGIQPLYVRRPDVEIARDSKDAGRHAARLD